MSLWSEVSEKFNEFVDLVKEGVADFTTLDVVTLTGSIDIAGQVSDDGIDLKGLYDAFKQNVSTNTDVSVVAFTHVDFDADSVNFAASDLTEEQKGLLLAHAENVKAAQEARAGMVRTVKALFK